MAVIFDGKAEAAKIKQELKQQLQSQGRKPKLGIVLVGAIRGSQIYVKRKLEAAAEIGVETELFTQEKFSLKPVATKLKDWAGDPKVKGIMVQLPLSGAKPQETEELLSLIPPEKDVDGLNPHNLKQMATGKQDFLPATVAAVEHILELAGAMSRDGLWAVVGAKGVVGEPLTSRLRFLGKKILALDQGDDLNELKQCEVIISATGVAGLIGGEQIKPGAVVIDVGFPLGDVRLDEVAAKASFITPVPGGVGPLTVVMLMKNLVTGRALASS